LPLLFGERPVPIIGHSLGGNVACVYAGLRPERLTHLVSLDGFGLPERDAASAPDRLVRWLDSLGREHPERPYPDLPATAERLRAANPRLSPDKALFMAEHLSRPAPGGFVWALDPAHRRPFAVPHRVAEWEACLRRITAPTLWLGSGSTFPPALDAEPGGLARRAALCRAELRRLHGTGHNLHHDAPEAVAREVEDFLLR
jgi:pimeloyl-ACP methyl ester carboxylesterase